MGVWYIVGYARYFFTDFCFRFFNSSCGRGNNGRFSRDESEDECEQPRKKMGRPRSEFDFKLLHNTGEDVPTYSC